jgi:acyl-CoA reductase-like NAD-dependent aldehyde dehydrogenase
MGRAQRRGTIEVVDPTHEEALATIPEGTTDDVDRAVAAARAAFDSWAAVSPYERAALMEAVAAALTARQDELAALIARELGMPIALSKMIQAGLPIATFASMPAVAEQITWEEQVGNSTIVLEPAGVVGAITPWNYPLHQIAAKVAPAMTAGCTVVLKPSEVVPLNAFVLAEAMGPPACPPASSTS